MGSLNLVKVESAEHMLTNAKQNKRKQKMEKGAWSLCVNYLILLSSLYPKSYIKFP